VAKRGKKKRSSRAPELTLPTERSVPSDNLWDYLILVYGEKKIGKTSMFSHADNPFYAMFEPGGRSLEIYQRPIRRWRDFQKYVQLLQKDSTENEEEGFNPVIVDTADVAYDMCLDHACFRLGIDHPTDAGYGKGWHAVKREFIKQVALLGATGKGVAFISHSAEREIKTRRGGTYDKIMPTMSNQARDVMEALVDIWVSYEYIGEERWLRILGDDHVAAGHRLTNRFRYTDGSPIRFIPAGNSSEETWTNFVAGFNNELDPGQMPRRRKKKKKVKTRRRKRGTP
jgi:hypothetical protein